jgi:hypothetical protein
MSDEPHELVEGTENQRHISHEEITTYLDALKEHVDRRRRDARSMRWTGIALLAIAIPGIAITAPRLFGGNWWIAVLAICALAVAASYLGRFIGRRMVEKEFGPHEEVLKKLIEAAERAKAEAGGEPDA